MKNSLQCPKCNGRKVWLIERLKSDDGYSNTKGEVVPVVKNRGGSERGAAIGHYDSYICAACGYAELWASGFRALEPDEANGVVLLDGEHTSGAYR